MTTKEMTAEKATAELTELADTITATAAELAAAESAGDTTEKGLDAHARIASRLAMLRTRQATLTAELPALKLADMQQEKEELRTAYGKTAADLKATETDLKSRLAAVMGLPETAAPVDVAMQASAAWIEAFGAHRRALGAHSSKHAKVLEHARNNGLSAA